MRHAIHSAFKSTAEIFLPVRSQSAIKEGVLTPEEFVQAGDYLVRTCPTWSWEAGEPGKRKPYLPQDKQYLITRNVPCVQRTAAVLDSVNSEVGTGLEGEDDWLQPSLAGTAGGGKEEATDISGVEELDAHGEVAQGQAPADDDDVPDIDDLAISDEGEEDEAAAAVGGQGGGSCSSANAAVLRTRTYDLIMNYDKYYQVPRLWLMGYDESGTPLTTEQVFEDVTEEHARKTITVDPFPHTSVSAASIHPCRHANVMKKLATRIEESGKGFVLDQYLILFLKFIASIVPNIEYDYTLAASL